MQKYYLVLIIAAALSGCATKIKGDEPWAKDLMGKSGYFKSKPSQIAFLSE